MTTDTRRDRLVRRVADLLATDQQFAGAAPSEAVNELIERPGVRLAEVVRTVMEGYGDRPALGQRAVHFVTDADGRTSAELLPKFDMITYRQLWDRVTAAVRALTNDPVRPADRVCILGFTSVDYTTVDMALLLIGAVSVPL
ncbi:MAG: AMP-binding protein, partial [Mycolicibacterium sp.]|nr:AMP-binding protein [Mycolicibacterium sp.]